MIWNNKALKLQRGLDFGNKKYVMGIINCTPDSFYGASRRSTREKALSAAREMEAAGVHILDIGGESSRPGAQPVEVEEELERVIPVIEEIRRESEILISVDTYKAETAARALDAGADLINDIYALRNTPSMAELVASREVPVILMHMKGDPENMQHNPVYNDTMAEILGELKTSVEFACSRGISGDLIILDPGIGFGKRLEDNLAVISRLDEIKREGYPLLMGLSRKSFMQTLLNREPEDRLAGTIAANTYALMKGADIIRVHDFREGVDTVKMVEALNSAGN